MQSCPCLHSGVTRLQIPLKHVMPEAVPQAVQPVEFSIMKCIRNLADMDFIQSREKQMKQALLKMKCVLEIGWEFSGVGTAVHRR